MDTILSSFTLESTIGLSRILFSLMVLANMAYVIYARDLNWAFRKPFLLIPCLFLLILSFVFILLGIQTGPASLVSFFLYVFLFHYSVFYGLENIIVQIIFTRIFSGYGDKFNLVIGIP